jgi:hypothetical protein
MKKIKVVLSALAIMLAIGGALASEAFKPLQVGYEFINYPGTEDDQCINRLNICDTSGDWDCKVNTSSPVLKDQSTPSTSCGTNLKRHTAPPAP